MHVRPAWGYGLPLVLALVAYLNTLDHGWVLDDLYTVVGTDHVVNGPTLPLTEATETAQRPYYRPFAFLGFGFDHALWGADPTGFHRTAVLLHVLATLAFAALCRALMGAVPALIAAALFAVHPVHVEAVANVWNRSGVQAALFYFLALVAHLKVSRLWVRVVAVNLLAFVALGSKESAVTLPGALLMIDWLRKDGRFTLTGALSVAPALAAWAVLRTTALAGHEVGFGDFYEGQTLWTAVCTNGVILWRYAVLLVAPIELRADYTTPTVVYADALSLSAVAGYAIWGLLAIGVVVGLSRRAPAALGAALLLVTIAPFLHLLPMGIPLAERWLYLPSAGLCMAAGEAIWRLSRHVRPRIVGALATGLVVCLLALTVARAAEWRGPLTLWHADAAKPDASAFTWGNLGLSLWNEGEYEAGYEAMRKAAELRPGWPPFERSLARMRDAFVVPPD